MSTAASTAAALHKPDMADLPEQLPQAPATRAAVPSSPPAAIARRNMPVRVAAAQHARPGGQSQTMAAPTRTEHAIGTHGPGSVHATAATAAAGTSALTGLQHQVRNAQHLSQSGGSPEA